MASKNPSAKTIIFNCVQNTTIISKKIQNFYKQNEFFDTVLIAGNNSASIPIQAHRVVLCALSEYFLEIFRGDQLTFTRNIVELQEIKYSTLKLIIDFMYSGSIELGPETAGEILRTAAFLKIKSLVDGCCKMIEENIDSSNSLTWFRLGYELSLSTLRTKAKEYIYTQFKEISKQTDLLMLSENELKAILFNSISHRRVLEEDIFLAVVAWLNFDELSRQHLVLELLSMIRFQALTPMFILENRKTVCKTVESYELICSWLQWHLSPENPSNGQGNSMETRSTNHQDCILESKNEKEKKKKLAVKRTICDGILKIDTFNPKENVWSTEIETRLLTNHISNKTIVIDSKLFLAGQKNVKYLHLYTNEWNDLPPMKKERIICHMVDLKGNLCVLGPEFNKNLISMEIYNFSTRKWHYVTPLYKKESFFEVATHDEMLYLLDAQKECLQSYNASSDKWTMKKIKIEPQYSYGFAAVEGFLYIIGGYNRTTRKALSSAKRYNLSNDSWCELASLPYAISDLKSTVFENKIIISNSLVAFEYNPNSDTWNSMRVFNSGSKDLISFDIFNLTDNS